MENTLIRSERCPDCGEEMLWTQNAWPLDSHTEAAFRCRKGHVSDPSTTRQCPACGVHDTRRVEAAPEGTAAFRCYRCSTRFTVPR
jgi:predicted RNA-binding Zn-ribbon protein involved in translation (DUF1610 family)